jgi:serine/threonine protein kinase
MTVQTAKLNSGATIQFLPEPIAEGTMEVYFTKDRQSVVCFFKDPSAGTDPQRRHRLKEILTTYNPTVARSDGGAAQDAAAAKYYRDYYCWPTAIVVQPRFGFVVPRIPDNFFFKDGPPDIKGKAKNGVCFLLSKFRARLEEHAPRELGTWREALLICTRMARGVMRMHQAGLAHSDLSPNNVLVDPTSGQCIIIIDIDSLVVPGLFPPDVLGTKGYIAPEVLSTIQFPLTDPRRKNPNSQTDLHALAVLIYQYLLHRHPLAGRLIPPGETGEEQENKKMGSDAIYCEHPADQRNRPELQPLVPASACGKRLESLFQRAFVEGIRQPERRPLAQEWLHALVKTFDQVAYCGENCPKKWFVVDPDASGPVSCPFCKKTYGYSFPILKLLRPKQVQPDGHLIGYIGLNLMEYHAYTDKFPGPGTNPQPVGQVQFLDNQWVLKNINLPGLKLSSGNPVPTGSCTLLRPGALLVLADPPNGRIVEVSFKNAHQAPQM